MNASIPIKDIETIKQIKGVYAANEDYSGLLLFLLAINTGAKLRNLLDLKNGDIKGKQYLNIGKDKSIPLNEEIKELVNKVTVGKNSSAPLFTCYKSDQPIDRSTVFYKFREICKELALKRRISVSSWRKTFGYFYYEKYKDLSFLQWYFNQKGVEETMQFIGIEENMNLRFKEGVCL